jgi:hypothetical protein
MIQVHHTGYIPERIIVNIQLRYLCTHVYHGISYNSYALESAQMPVNG